MSTRELAEAIHAIFSDDPTDASEQTIIGLPAPARLPAEPAGAKYRRLYPPKLDLPLIVCHRVDGIDWSAR